MYLPPVVIYGKNPLGRRLKLKIQFEIAGQRFFGKPVFEDRAGYLPQHVVVE